MAFKFKPIVFKHLLRINPKCKLTTVQRFKKAMVTENSKFDVPGYNILGADWLSEYIVYIYSDKMLGAAFQRLAKKFRFNMIFSYAEDSMIDVEYSCGIGRVGSKNQMAKLPRSKLHRFAFGTMLLNESPISFAEWEKETIKGGIAKYYFEHFIEKDARKKLKRAFSGKLATLASYMLEVHLGLELPWEAVNKHLDLQLK